MNPWHQIHRFREDMLEPRDRKNNHKPITEMTKRELLNFIHDPWGPDYGGNRHLARMWLLKRGREDQ